MVVAVKGKRRLYEESGDGLADAASKIRAQRKFAQGVAVVNEGNRPPKKEKKKKKKKGDPHALSPSPTSSPTKRPKTEDFLSFLCYRGTPVLPPELEFFNFLPVPKLKDEVPGDKKATVNVKNATLQQNTQKESPRPHVPKEKSASTPNKESSKSTESKVALKKKSVTSVKPQKDSVVKPVKVALTKLVSPKSSRINEQEAQFAISALKLKYQEKRLSKLQAAKTVVSKLTKKVKERVILTRSKARNTDQRSSKSVKESGRTNSPERKLRKDKRPVPLPQDSEGRNVPSPDIIYGGRTRERTDTTKSSSSESSDDSSSSSEEEEKAASKVMLKSLRGGRTYVLETKKATKIKKRLVPNRVSTRASRRNAASPLRELPMYGVVKKKKKSILSSKLKKMAKKESPSRRESRDSESSGRPTRKTKENAAIYLGLINKDFSSDENESDDEKKAGKGDDDSSGHSSSSETKFLEKQYHACLKREKIKKRISGKAEKDNDKEKKKRQKAKSKALEELKKREKKKATEKKRVPEKRILRSQSTKDTYRPHNKESETEDSARVTRRRISAPVSSCDRTLTGAARKTASQVPRRNVQQNSSSSSSESDSDSDDEPPPPIKKVKQSSSSISSPKVPAIPASSSESEQSEVDDTTDEEDSYTVQESSPIVKKSAEPKMTREMGSGQASSSASEADSEGQIDSSESDSSESEEEEVPVQKVSIAIQVDMDSEENAELELNEYHNSQQHQDTAEVVDPVPVPVSIPEYLPEVDRGHGSAIRPPLLIPYSGSGYFPAMGTSMNAGAGLISQQHDFSLVFPNLNIPGMPGGLPMHSFGSQLSAYSSILSAQGPLCFTTPQGQGHISTSSTTLQTHIRSVAANLDIPLVRPVVAVGTHSHSSMLTLPFPSSRHQNIPLTRPVVTPNPWPDHRATTQTQSASTHYSAFRIPFSSASSCPSTSASASSTSSSSRLYTPLATTRAPALVMTRGLGPSPASSFAPSQNQPSLVRAPVSKPPRTGLVEVPASAPTAQPKPKILHPQSHGLSLIQSLPNVSIVPKFDRTSKPISIPPEQCGTESSPNAASTSKAGKKKSKQDSESKEPKKEKGKVGRKPKVIVVPPATSPLTVRKDSSSPATYIGLASKKQHKEKQSSSQSSAQSTSKKSSGADQFNKLIQSKALESGSSRSSPVSSPCPSDPSDKERTKEEEKKEQVPDVPAYYPTEAEFQDPLKYIEQIQAGLTGIGMCRIVPPRSFRPECNVEDDMRFTAYNHYIHRMHKRWGPNVHERMAILEHLRKSKVDVTTAPMIGGMEVDLATLFHTVQSFGGLKEVIEKHKWNKVSDAMHIPKAANDRATKLDGIYVKYVLPYEMLSENERKKLLAQVEEKWRCRENRSSNDEYSDSESDEDDPFEELEDCIVKGKSTPLSSYYRVARNTLSMIFRNREPTYAEVETSYWRQVQDKTRHLCVYSGSIDCAGVGWGFPLPKASMKHPWNLKVLANSPASILRSMGPVMGATVPTLHVGMVFTTYCWYRDPQRLPWVEYLHSGGNKIWYVVPGGHEARFREVLSELMPAQCRNKKIWLPSDSAMVPLDLLISRGVPIYRAVQNPGEFLVVFPNAFTSAICTGYVISESVSFASARWLNTAQQTFEDIRESKEPPVFALEKLLMSIVADTRSALDALKKAVFLAGPILKEEFSLRKKLRDFGVSTGKMDAADEKIPKGSKKKEEKEVFECDNCNYILHFSVVVNKTHEFVYCLPHAIKHLSKTKSHIKSSCLLVENSETQLNVLLEAARARLK